MRFRAPSVFDGSNVVAHQTYLGQAFGLLCPRLDHSVLKTDRSAEVARSSKHCGCFACALFVAYAESSFVRQLQL